MIHAGGHGDPAPNGQEEVQQVRGFVEAEDMRRDFAAHTALHNENWPVWCHAHRPPAAIRSYCIAVKVPA